MVLQRAPYGRQPAIDRAPADGATRLPIPTTAEYAGETYYGTPALKPTHYGHLISGYFFVGGIAGSNQILSAIAEFMGQEDDRFLVRNGRYLAVAGAMTSPVLLITDLYTPGRWYNMVRIFRSNSTMSIGAWVLAIFGTFSGATAAMQFLGDRTGHPAFRQLARWLELPAAATGALMSTYTGTLMAASSNPLWMTGGRLLPLLFGTSAMSTATAALSLGECLRGGQAPSASQKRLEKLGDLASASELAVLSILNRRWREKGVSTPLEQEPTRSTYNIGFKTVGVIAPLLIHGTMALTGRYSKTMSMFAAAATLAGGYLLRHVLVSAGNESARRPDDYFRVTQPEHRQRKPVSGDGKAPSAEAEHQPPRRGQTDLIAACRRALESLNRALERPSKQIVDELDEAEVSVVRIRDALIDQIRQDPESPETARRRHMLGQVNSALSLIVGGEYPLSRIKRNTITEARDALQKVLDAGLEL